MTTSRIPLEARKDTPSAPSVGMWVSHAAIGEAHRRGPDPGVSVAREQPLAQPDRAALVARQAGDRRAGADVDGPRAHGPGASALRMRTPGTAPPTCPLKLH